MQDKHDSDSDLVDQALHTASHLLPDQGPIGVFIHHNTLHGFQKLRFHDAVQQASALSGTRPYLDLQEFQTAYRKQRIEHEDLLTVLNDHLNVRAGESVGLGLDRLALWQALMLQDLCVENPTELSWLIKQQPPVFRELIATAFELIDILPPLWHEPKVFHRHAEVLQLLRGSDTDGVVHDELIRLAAAFLDQGQALAVMPDRDMGFLQAVAGLFTAGAVSPRGAPGVAEDFRKIAQHKASAAQVITRCLEELGIGIVETNAFIVASTTALAGWAGMFARLENHPDENHVDAPATLADFVAVRLVLECRALQHFCLKTGLPVQWKALLAQVTDTRAQHRTEDSLVLFTLAQAAGLDAEKLREVPEQAILGLWQEVVACTPLKRRELWMDAYERRYYRQILDGIAALRPHRLFLEPDQRPQAQYLFCMDEREESVRRAIEEQGSQWQTFGLAGFFGVAIDYQGLYDHTPAAYCPVVVTPAHEVHETPVYTHRNWHITRNRLRNAWRAARRVMHYQSRTLSGGAGMALILGPYYALVAALRILLPHASLGLHDKVTKQFSPVPETRLLAVRQNDNALLTARGKLLGFTLEEATDRVAGVLNSIGLVKNFAPIIMVLGHGSTSLNNPHESAHDCGACGGRRGGANARLFAALANLPEIRSALKAKGISIPSDSWFIGGLHDTANDDVSYSDLAALPHSLEGVFDAADKVLDQGRRISAAERCRRFYAATLPITPDDGLKHVETRARQLGQPRPEYGHCTNAFAIVGRRSLSRGLHFDRRAFLISYDPTVDKNHAIIERILAAAGPVGAGISLEYYFSSVDNERYGCGTKLPHNVIGLMGIMNGHKSDLRTGLPLQMVEIHEPMRLLVICESTPEALLQVAGNQPEVYELVVNRWIQLACVDPDTGAMHMYTDSGFVPYTPSTLPLPEVEISADYHGLHRDHLSPAVVKAALRNTSVSTESAAHA